MTHVTLINRLEKGMLKPLVFVSLLANVSFAETSLQQAQLLYSRLAAVKLSQSSPVLLNISQLIEAKKWKEAADVAIGSEDFSNVSLFQFFAPLSSRIENPDIELNDFIAMGIANSFIDPVTNKDRPYTNLVDGDFSVTFNNAPLSEANNTVLTNAFNTRTVLTPANLKIVSPQRINIPSTAAAGLLTSRQFLKEHAIAGTNRRMVHYAFREFLCSDIKEWKDGDPAITDEFVSRDVSRAPGGGIAGAQQYQAECRTCHQLQDGMRNAFAKHDFSGTTSSAVYSATTIVPKINFNNLFPGGMVVTDDSWENKATRGANAARFGWRGPLSGNGAKAFGQMIGRSFRFSTCAVEKVFKQVCKRALIVDEQLIKESLARGFEGDGYSLRGLFKSVALVPECMGVKQ
ncbi:MAG: hypothetical protein HQ462_06115 [Deltaproteobacteria bacterium]|nr:hypothetical protein [Deltaproteobacteria bacterium]